jgi:TonB-linked SusC/RagA family outer membrane protein
MKNFMKWIPKMQITCLLIFYFSYGARAQLMASAKYRLTTQDHKSLKRILSEMEMKYQISFSYDTRTIADKELDYGLLKFNSLEKELDHVTHALHLKYEKLNKKVYLLTALKPSLNPIDLPPAIGKPSTLSVPVSSTPTQSPLFAHSVTKPIQGRVISHKDPDGIPGVTVMIKGSQIGTTTDKEGRFTIDIADSKAILVFSHIGFDTQEILIGNQTKLEISLIESAETLKEAVVTALGIKREKRSLGYSVGSVDGLALTQTPQSNVLNSLQGKVAGVQISQMGGGVGSSVNMVIRGQSSLNSDNQPLFVIDGVPVKNKTNNGFAGADMGNPISDLNPNDIENVAVLKGPSAAALYGSRAGQGVVLITTKSGKRTTNGIGISLNTSVVLDLPIQYVEVQNKFGSGKLGAHLLEEQENESWGAELDAGEMWVQWDSKGEKVPLISHPNRFKDFFQTGVTNTNDVAVNGSYDKGNFRLSVGNMKNKGLIPNTDLDRLTIALNTSYNLSKNLKASVNFNVTETGSDNRPMIDASRNDAVRSVYETGAQVDINKMRNYWIPGQEGLAQVRYKDKQNNPFYIAYENPTGFKRDRTVSKVQLDYNLTDDLVLTGRYARDAFSEKMTAKKAFNNFEFINGAYEMNNTYFKETNADLLLSYKKTIGKNWNLQAMAGTSRMDQRNEGLYNNATSLVVPGLYTISNGSPGAVIYTSSWSRKRMYGIFGSASMGYKDQVYLDLTARNDWTSTLPKGNNSYFYPSASLSVILSEMIKMPKAISFAKVRAGLAQVGNDVAPYSLHPTYSMDQDWGPAKRMYMDGVLKNATLKPEIATSSEYGLDMKFFGNRLGFEATYFNKNNRNQVISVGLPVESGAVSKMINAGVVQSKGFEVTIQTTPVKTEKFTWEMNFTLTRTRTYLKDMNGGEFPFFNYSGAIVKTFQDGEIGDIFQQPMLKVTDPNSPYYNYPIVTSGGLYQTDNNPGAMEKIGNYNHKIMMGIQPSISYKRFSIYANVDVRVGGQFYSNTMMFLGNNGQLNETISGVEYDRTIPIEDQIKQNPEKFLGNWIGGRNEKYGGFAWAEGSVESTSRKQDASLNPGVFSKKLADGTVEYSENLGGPGSKWIDPFSAYRYANRPFPSQNLYSATYIKLREVAASYRLPSRWLREIKMQGATVSVVGNNLFMWTRAGIKGVDPERAFRQNGSAGWQQGVEYYNILPYTGSVGFKLSVDF